MFEKIKAFAQEILLSKLSFTQSCTNCLLKHLHNICPIGGGYKEKWYVMLFWKLEALFSHRRIHVYLIRYQNAGYGWAVLS